MSRRRRAPPSGCDLRDKKFTNDVEPGVTPAQAVWRLRDRYKRAVK